MKSRDSSEIKQPGREAEYSSPPTAEVNYAWNCSFSPPYVFMAWCLTKHRNFTSKEWE